MQTDLGNLRSDRNKREKFLISYPSDTMVKPKVRYVVCDEVPCNEGVNE